MVWSFNKNAIAFYEKIGIYGSIHCYNVVDDCIFDLTSEQFGEDAKDLVYEENEIQHRDSAIHFQKEEKKLRYEYIRQKLKERCCRI